MNEIRKINPADVGEGRNPRTLIRYVLKNEGQNLIEALNEKCYDPEYADENGKTALSVAVEHNNTECISILLQAGCNPNSPNAFVPPIIQALRMERYIVATILLDAGCNVDFNEEGKPLALLCELCKRPRWCLSAKNMFDRLVLCCDVNQIDDQNGATPLHYAVGFGQPSTITLLLEKGANLHAVDMYGRTPLHFAASFDAGPGVFRHLLLAGCMIDLSKEDRRSEHIVPKYMSDQLGVTDKKGRTPLHIVLQRYMTEIHVEIVRYLVKTGSKLNVPDNKGITPLELISYKIKETQNHFRTQQHVIACARILFRAQAKLEAKLEADRRVDLLIQRAAHELRSH